MLTEPAPVLEERRRSHSGRFQLENYEVAECDWHGFRAALHEDGMKYLAEYRLEANIVSMNIHSAINQQGNSN